MLRAAFPVNVRSDFASFDIQYGYAKRPTHRNTSWDMARFEVAAHKYIDLSDLDYGVALLNDCKYGHKVHDNVLDLNLLRAPTYPDADADLGKHSFTYSLLPHKGDLVASDVMAEASLLNQPVSVFAGSSIRAVSALPVQVESDSVQLEVLKKAEKEDCLVIRLVERAGRKGSATLAVAGELIETDLMEWHDAGAVGKGKVELSFEPFEIRTFKIK